MTQEIRLIHGTDRIGRLAQRPDIANAVRQIRAAMAEASRAYAECKFFSYTREQFIEEFAHPDDRAAPGARPRHDPTDYSPISGLHGL
jgi:hypothetical protein